MPLVDWQKMEEQIEEQAEVDADDLEPHEFIFLIDRSGSMFWGNSAGTSSPMTLAKDALKVFIHSLPEGSKFNIIGFGSSHEVLFDGVVVDYNEDTLQQAIDDIEDYDDEKRCLGGTEILQPLKYIFDQEKVTNLPQDIYVLTDGAVSNTGAIVELVKEQTRKSNTRVHTFGFGSGADT